MAVSGDPAGWDRLALVSPDIDQFCSASAWGMSAAEALMEPAPLILDHGDAGLVALACRVRDGARIIESLEATWGLGSPLIGRDPDALAGALLAILAARSDWDLAVIPGLPLGSPLLEAVAAALDGRYRLARGPVTRRHIASLAGGVDGFLARRSAGVRKSLRRAARRAAGEGIVFESYRPSGAGLDDLFDRAVAVEAHSWKGRAGGLATWSMREFYQRMSHRLAERGQLRLLFGRRGAEDLVYVLGAVFGDSYRGLQFSFDDRHRALGLGNLAQLRQIEALAEEPGLRRYDLGTGGEYKGAWAERVSDSLCLVAVRT
jgi:hypothetical protein